MSTTEVQKIQYDNLSYEDYLSLPEMNLRYDIVDGRLILMPSPELLHQLCLGELFHLLRDYVKPRHIGIVIPAPFDVLIRRDPRLQCRQPDILFVSFARLGVGSTSELRDRNIRPLEVPPELAVEILSEDNRPSKVQEKMGDYASIGVDEVWIVDPENRQIDVLYLDGIRYSRSGLYSESDDVRSCLFPDLRFRIGSIFEE